MLHRKLIFLQTGIKNLTEIPPMITGCPYFFPLSHSIREYRIAGVSGILRWARASLEEQRRIALSGTGWGGCVLLLSLQWKSSFICFKKKKKKRKKKKNRDGSMWETSSFSRLAGAGRITQKYLAAPRRLALSAESLSRHVPK
jgi:hypothetical protein